MSYFNVNNGKMRHLTDLFKLKQDNNKNSRHKIVKDFKNEGSEAIEFQNIDSLECMSLEDAIDMHNLAFKNQLNL